MSCSVTIKGSIIVNTNSCASACTSTAGSNITSRDIGASCSGTYTGVSSTDCPVHVATSGVVGSSYVDIPGVDTGSVALFQMSSNLPVSVRFNADEARLVGASASFPVTMSGGEEITFILDGTSVAVVFTVGAKTAQDCANAINSSAAFAGLGYMPASVLASGQLQVATDITGKSSTAVVGSTVTAAIGFAADTSVTGAGDDIGVTGIMANFSPEISRIQISTGASGADINVLAASKL